MENSCNEYKQPRKVFHFSNTSFLSNITDFHKIHEKIEGYHITTKQTERKQESTKYSLVP